ncbi:MAG: AAA family ATPase [Flavobacterium sp.]|nr:AAA family ATPase [Flavobacterium sp.]
MEVLNQPISPENFNLTHYKDNKFSIVNNAKDNSPNTEKNIKEIYSIIKSDTFKTLIEQIRAESSPKKIILKHKLKAFCVGGTFAVRNKTGLLIYSGFVHSDIDGLTPVQMIAFAKILTNSPFIILFFISPSGTGFKVFAKVNSTAEKHLQAWTQFNRSISDLLGVATDPAPKSIASLCFFSYDPNAFFNENSEIFQVNESKEPEQTPKANASVFIGRNEQQSAIVEQVDTFIIKAAENLVNGFDSESPRHPQIAKTKTPFGLLKQYPQNTVYNQVYEMFENAMSTHLYGSVEVAKAKNAFKSLSTAQSEAVPMKDETLEFLLYIEATVSNKEYRDKFRIDVNEAIPPPQIALYINDAIFGTLGNFSVITGKAKAKKSFLVSIAVAAALTGKLLHGILQSELPPEQNEVAFFDTEQSKYHVQIAVRRICTQIGINEPENLHAFHLRSFAPKERLQFIENEIYSNDKLGFVVIDGIKDLITSINSEEDASMISSKLLKWTEERNIHIVTVLHQNKSDTNARGHLGTELINKAETVLSVTVLEHDKEISIVEPQQTRNREPEPFAFKIDENGIPFIISEFDNAKPKKENANNINTLQSEKIYEIITDAFSNDKLIKYAELVRRVKASYIKIIGVESFGDNKARNLISLCKGRGFIGQRAEREPYILLPYMEDDDLL